jgi:hypothetical protein
MDLKSFLVATLEKSTVLLKMTVADMTDAELLERPVEGSNVANWQIGHLISAQAYLFGEVGMPKVELPAGFQETYGGKPKAEGPKNWMKEELLGLLDKVNGACVAWVKTLSDEQLAAPTPEKYRRIGGTVADMVNLPTGHNAMHIGQIQVLRRRLGKPILF